MLLPWTWAAVGAGVLAVIGLALRVTVTAPRSADLTVETAIVLGLYSLWQEGGSLAETHVAGAVANAHWVWHAQRDLHLPDELSVQHLILAHPLLVQAVNGFYDIVHVPALIAFLIWMYVRHRADYSRWRTIGAMLTGSCLLIQMVPVAPPRLLPQLGFVDTAMRYHESVYAPGGIGDATQLAAMPSVHVAWSVFVATAVIMVSTSRWRWLIIAHPAATLFAVVATANHWWLDAIVAAALLPLSAAVYVAARAAVRRLPGLAEPQLTTPRWTSSSAIWTALRAAPLRRLSPETNSVNPRPDGSL
jgi:hypothetical protein